MFEHERHHDVLESVLDSKSSADKCSNADVLRRSVQGSSIESDML